MDCTRLEINREDERCRVLEQLAAMPVDVSRDQVIQAIRPVAGEPMRWREPRVDLG